MRDHPCQGPWMTSSMSGEKHNEMKNQHSRNLRDPHFVPSHHQSWGHNSRDRTGTSLAWWYQRCGSYWSDGWMSSIWALPWSQTIPLSSSILWPTNAPSPGLAPAPTKSTHTLTMMLLIRVGWIQSKGSRSSNLSLRKWCLACHRQRQWLSLTSVTSSSEKERDGRRMERCMQNVISVLLFLSLFSPTSLSFSLFLLVRKLQVSVLREWNNKYRSCFLSITKTPLERMNC